MDFIGPAHTEWVQRTSRMVLTTLALLIASSSLAFAATFKVNSFADDLTPGDGSCTLREAIIAANTGVVSADCPARPAPAAIDVIRLPPGTYDLTLENMMGGDPDDAQTGDLDIVDDVRIVGAGAQRTTINGNNIDRVFHVLEARLALDSLTIINGQVAGLGGGIYNFGGELNLSRTTIRDCIAAENGVNDGGGIANIGGVVRARYSTISHNTSTDSGGGIYNENSDTDVGRIVLNNSVVYANQAEADGGGIRNEGGSVRMVETTVSGNTTMDDGGGLRNNGGKVEILRSTVSANVAEDPDGNTNFGGGIFNDNGAILRIVNSTVSGNVAADQGGAIRNENDGSIVHVLGSTVTGNKAGSRGGGIRNIGDLTLAGSIVGGNAAGDSGADCSNSGTLTSRGHNLVGDGTGCPSDGPNDQIVDPAEVFTTVLGPLQDNGGPTRTHALALGSPAVDTGPASCTRLKTDQRGVNRPLGRRCDIGAFEEFTQHYTAYPVRGDRLNVDVKLADKFGRSKQTATMARHIFLPAQVDDTPVDKSAALLKCYALRPTEKGPPVHANVKVSVENWFNGIVGEQIFKVHKLENLCVPQKRPGTDTPPAGVSVETFSCYSVTGMRPKLDVDVQVTDRFGTSRQTVNKARQLCVPTQKNGTEVANNLSELACYDVARQRRGRSVGAPKLLCVPSRSELR